MKKSTKVRLASFSAAFLLVLGGLLLDARLLLNSSKTELEYTYRRALNDLSDYVSGMRSTLKKAAYVNTPVLRGTVSAKLLEQSGGAKAAMAVLPFSQEKTDRISRFLSQIGDYAMMLSRKSLTDAAASEEELQNLSSMERYAGILTDALAEIQARLSVEKASVGKTESLLNNVDEIDSLPSFDDSLDEVAKEFSEFPSLLYDGPFSDHILRREALFLKGKAEITAGEAAQKAAAFLHCKPEELEALGTGGSAIEAYVFSRGDSRIQVTRLGGEIAYFKKSADVPEEKLSYEEALQAAAAMLREAGISSFQESYYVKNDNQCTINFSYLSEEGLDVVCYPDLIKVTVELGEGAMLEYDATGYLMNHHSRELVAPALDAETAKKNVSPLLTVKSSALALIPTPGLSEVLCWEFLCKDRDGGEVLVYINAESGLEEQLYLLQKDEHGVLTI